MTVLEWLLDCDPSIRWQVLAHLQDQPTEVVAAERARVAVEGWGARLLALQAPDGQWGGATYLPDADPTQESTAQPWTPTTHTLVLLRQLGVDSADPVVRGAVDRVEANSRWEHAGQPYFEGEVEPCINAMPVAIGPYFGRDVRGIVDRLLGDQLQDGGWNCWAEYGSVRSSFHITINVLEGLLEHQRVTEAPPT